MGEVNRNQGFLITYRPPTVSLSGSPQGQSGLERGSLVPHGQ